MVGSVLSIFSLGKVFRLGVKKLGSGYLSYFLTKLQCPADSVVWCRGPIIDAPDENSVYLMAKGQFFLLAEVKESLSGKRAEIQRIYSEVYQISFWTS